MTKGIFYVETFPASPDVEAEYNAWYDNIHLPEVLACPGFVSARRFAPTEAGMPYVAIYEIESNDVMQAVAEMLARSDSFTPTAAMQTEPPALARTLVCSVEYPAVR